MNEHGEAYPNSAVKLEVDTVANSPVVCNSDENVLQQLDDGSRFKYTVTDYLAL